MEVLYVADQDAPDYVCDMVRSAMLADVRIRPTHLSVQFFARNMLRIHGIFAGTRMVSPLQAANFLDESLMRSLAVTGLSEEFDVSRRSLNVGPSEQIVSASRPAAGLRSMFERHNTAWSGLKIFNCGGYGRV